MHCLVTASFLHDFRRFQYVCTVECRESFNLFHTQNPLCVLWGNHMHTGERPVLRIFFPRRNFRKFPPSPLPNIKKSLEISKDREGKSVKQRRRPNIAWAKWIFYCRHWIFPRFDPKKLSFRSPTDKGGIKGKEEENKPIAEDNSNFPELEKGNGTLLPSLLIRTEITPLLFSFLFLTVGYKKATFTAARKIKEGRKGRKKDIFRCKLSHDCSFPKKKKIRVRLRKVYL